MSTMTRGRLDTADLTAPCSGQGIAGVELVDPLEDDRLEDVPVVTTERRLQRLAIVACDTASRFAREGLVHDPVAWMLSPREMFGGERALDACQEFEGFMRATLLHGLSLGLDAAPEELDALLEDEADDEHLASGHEGGNVVADQSSARLFTCVLEGRVPASGHRLQAFCAMVANDENEVRRRLRERYGDGLGDAADVRTGFEVEGPVADVLLSPALRRMLAVVAADPSDPIGDGLDVQVEQRFAA